MAGNAFSGLIYVTTSKEDLTLHFLHGDETNRNKSHEHWADDGQTVLQNILLWWNTLFLKAALEYSKKITLCNKFAMRSAGVMKHRLTCRCFSAALPWSRLCWPLHISRGEITGMFYFWQWEENAFLFLPFISRKKAAKWLFKCFQ